MLKSVLLGGVFAAAMAFGPADAAQMKIGLVQIDLSNPFHVGEVEGAKEAARRYGFDLRVVSGEGGSRESVVDDTAVLVPAHAGGVNVSSADALMPGSPASVLGMVLRV